MIEVDPYESLRIDYIPSPQEIHEACQMIRAGWSLNERRRRFVGPYLPEELPPAWQPPVIDTSTFRLAMTPGSGFDSN